MNEKKYMNCDSVLSDYIPVTDCNLTKREYFALHLAAGMNAKMAWPLRDIVSNAVEQADLLLAKLEERAASEKPS